MPTCTGSLAHDVGLARYGTSASVEDTPYSPLVPPFFGFHRHGSWIAAVGTPHIVAEILSNGIPAAALMF